MNGKSIRTQRSTCRQRRGFSLLEVILSVAILGGALVVISHGFYAGYRSASRARLQKEANMLCDSKMAELVAGVIDASNASGSPIEGYPEWKYSVDLGDADTRGLLMARVTVERETESRPVTVSVVRFIPDPDYDPLEDNQ